MLGGRSPAVRARSCVAHVFQLDGLQDRVMAVSMPRLSAAGGLSNTRVRDGVASPRPWLCWLRRDFCAQPWCTERGNNDNKDTEHMYGVLYW